MLGTVELGEVLLGEVLLGLVVLPGMHGLATVAEVPLGCEAEAVVVLDPVELPMPLFAVAEVLPVEGVLLAVVVPVLPLFEGVHGATVVEVPVSGGSLRSTSYRSRAACNSRGSLGCCRAAGGGAAWLGGLQRAH